MTIVTSRNEPPIAVPNTRRAPSTSLRPQYLADEDGRGHAEAEHEGGQQEHHHVGVGRRGERALAEEAADPDRVDGAVQRLQDRGGERRQRELQQGRADAALGEVAAAEGFVCAASAIPSPFRHPGLEAGVQAARPRRFAACAGPRPSPG